VRDVILAQLTAAAANVAAAMALFEATYGDAPAPAPIIGGPDCQHPNKVDTRPGHWVCLDCSHNHEPLGGRDGAAL